MGRETKICQNCSSSFEITKDDLQFYNRIKVPPPTFCPECRLIRRMNFRNERSLYKRKCDATGRGLISIYSPDKTFKVYDHAYWWSDEWDPMKYARKYNFTKPFFIEFRELFVNVPHISIFNNNPVNSDYCSHGLDLKNCYLTSSSVKSENVSYSNRTSESRDSFDIYRGENIELCYEDVICNNSYELLFSQYSDACNNSIFLFGCKNCSHCLGCVNLRNKSYHIFNKPCTKEEYKKELEKLDFGSYTTLLAVKEKFKKFIQHHPRKYANVVHIRNVTGDNVRDAKNAYYCFDGENVENFKYGEWLGYKLRDSYDILAAGLNSELIYESIGIIESQECFFNLLCYYGRNVRYSVNCHNCNNIFGCIGLRNKQYCILNKQYTKQEYEKLVPKIVQQMNDIPYIDKKRRVYKYGEFFPPEISPFAYNETIAQEYFPLTKEQAIKQGYTWKDSGKRDYEITIKPQDLPDHIKEVDDSIINEIIECANHSAGVIARSEATKQSPAPELSNCTTAFKIIPDELQFYKKMNLPLPRLCPNCRHYQRLRQRNPLKLWHRKCQCAGDKSDNKVYQNTIKHLHGTSHCPNEFETTYAPDRKEIVYCEKCYQQEII